MELVMELSSIKKIHLTLFITLFFIFPYIEAFERYTVPDLASPEEVKVAFKVLKNGLSFISTNNTIWSIH